MLSYLTKLAFRNLRRNWTYSLINTLGLAIGLASILTIGLWVKNELSYDRFEKNAGRIYRLTVEVNKPNGYKSHFARCSQNWINLMPDHFPSIEAMALFSPQSKTSVKFNDIKFNTENVFQCNQAAIKVFSIDLMTGDPQRALSGPNKILLSENMVKKYFGDTDISGKTLKIASLWDETFKNYEVSGIFRDFPSNSHFHPEILISMDNPAAFEGWAYTYLLLKNGTSPSSISDNFKTFSNQYVPEDQRLVSKIHLQKLTRIHLYSSKDREIEKNGDARLVIFFSLTGLIIFGLALINYINLSMALIFRKKKTLVIGRIFGARFIHIFSGIFLESFFQIFSVAAISVAAILVYYPYFSDFLPEGFVKENTNLIILFTFIISLFSSFAVSVPQFIVLARPFAGTNKFFPQHINLVTLLKSKNTGMKRFLVVAQFTASVTLIICAVYFTKQKDYLLRHRLGADDSPVVLLSHLNWQVKGRYFEFKNQAMQNHRILAVTGTMEEPSSDIMDTMPFTLSGLPDQKNDLALYVSPVDDNFFDFFHLDIIAGHNFNPYPQDSASEEYIINESALKYLGFHSPEEAIGRYFKPQFDMKGIFKGGTITGVVKDFCFATMRDKIKPVVFFQKPIWYWNFMVKIDSSNESESIRYLKSVWDKVYPDYVFDYSFNDQSYDRVYNKEIMQSRLSNYFMILAMIISSLGLYGLASIMIEQRTKEIGIRKVIGARSGEILLMLNRDFTLWVVLSVLLAVPLAWYLLSRWNENYAYRTPLSWWIFVMAGIVVVAVSWLTVSYRTIKASRKNPAEALRYE